MDQIKDLLVRLFLNFRTSIDGALLAVIAWLVANGVNLSDGNRSKIIAVGALIAGAVWKLFSKDPVPQPADPNTGSTATRTGLLLVICLALPLGLAACGNPDQAQRTIVAGTYDAQLAILASEKTSMAFNARGRLSLDKHKLVTTKLRGISNAFGAFSSEIEKWPTIDEKSKPALLTAASGLISTVGTIAADPDLLALDADTLSQVRRGVVIGVALAESFKVALASAPAGTAVKAVMLDTEKARALQAKALKDFTDQDAALTTDIITIWSDFLVQVKLQKGQPVDTLRAWRDKLVADLQKIFTTELARA